MTLPNPSSSRRQVPLPFAIALQALSGLLLGAALAAAGSVLGTQLLMATTRQIDPATGGVVGILAGYPLGLGLGVAWAGRRTGWPAPRWAALLGAIAGSWLPPTLLSGIVRGDARLLWGIVLLLGLAGALAGHHRRRRMEDRSVSEA